VNDKESAGFPVDADAVCPRTPSRRPDPRRRRPQRNRHAADALPRSERPRLGGHHRPADDVSGGSAASRPCAGGARGHQELTTPVNGQRPGTRPTSGGRTRGTRQTRQQWLRAPCGTPTTELAACEAQRGRAIPTRARATSIPSASRTLFRSPGSRANLLNSWHARADIIDLLTMYPDARRRVVRLLGEIEAATA